MRFKTKKGTTGPRKKKPKFNKAGHRSGLETKVDGKLKELGVNYKYESDVIPFLYPAKPAKYTPDFVVTRDKTLTYVEVKGKLDRQSRQKMVLVSNQNPKLRFVFCFQKPDNVIYKGSKTTYAMWAEKNGFEWCTPDTLGEYL